jgi:DNA-binding MarR family transcriptional regulator
MKFEDLIVQTINILSQSMRQSMREYKEQVGQGDLFNLTITQLHYLHAVRELENPSFSQLVEKFRVQKPTVTAIINKLIQRGYVRKVQSVEDLRIFHVCLSDKGNQLLELEDEGYRRFATATIQCLDRTELDQFITILSKVTERIITTK